MTIEYKATKTRFGGMEVEQSHIENFQARIAIGLINQHGLIAAAPNGVDDVGRAMLRPLEPEEVVKKAFSIAELAVAEIISRGWLIKVEEAAETAPRPPRSKQEPQA